MDSTGLILSRGLAYAALLLAAGVPLYGLTARTGSPVSGRQRLGLIGLALAAGAASAWWALESVAAMAGLPLSGLDRETVSVVLAATPLGTVLEWRLTALAGLVVAALVPLRHTRRLLLVLAGAAALCTMAWTGHAGATEGGAGTLHRAADVVHLLAAATWLGALLTFLAHAFGRAEGFEHELAAFARTGTGIVALLLLTGVVNTLSIAGWPLDAAHLTSPWGLLLGVKLALFGAMLGLAAINRWRLTPALASADATARRHLRISLLVETGLGLGVVAVVAMLGVLDPAALG